MRESEEILDGVRELITIGIGRSAGMLNRLTRTHVTLHVPQVSISDEPSACASFFPSHPSEQEKTTQVIQHFSGELTGSLHLIIPYSSALNLVVLLSGEGGSLDEMDVLRVETLLEVCNIVISSIMSGLSILLTSRLSFQHPKYQSIQQDGLNIVTQKNPNVIIFIKIDFIVADKKIEGYIVLFLSPDSYHNLKSGIYSVMEKGL